MPDRKFPLRPNLDQFKRQAKELLRDLRASDPEAIALWRLHSPKSTEAARAKLADAQVVLARSYGLPSWPRLVLSCKMTNALWAGDREAVRTLILGHPELLTENATSPRSNWGPPMSFAANLGDNEMIEMLRGMGAADLQHAFERACLQGKVQTARKLFAMGARPKRGSVMGPCETLNPQGLALQLELGARLEDEHGDRLAPVGLLLQTYSRWPEGKHQCLEIVEHNGVTLPDTAPMSVHRGRIDLLERHLQADPQLFSRTFSHREVYPLELGCSEDESLALHGTPLGGGTLLHMCVDFDEFEIAEWMLARGANPDAPAAVDKDGFGGHTALFGCVVSQSFAANCRKDAEFARLLLDRGADPNARASLRKRLRFVDDESVHEYRDVTPLTWGKRFHNQDWVNREVMKLISAAIANQQGLLEGEN